jgi:uncharacterized RDD family membrane protein YckC
MHTASLIPPHRCASFWKRFHAYGYDSLIVLVLGWVISWQLGSIAHAQTPEMQQQIQTLVSAGMLPAGTDATSLTASLGESLSHFFNLSDMVVPLCVSALYNIFFLAGGWQATPGKRFCGIYVVNADGEKLTLAQSALRHAASGLSTLALGLPYLTIFFTREKLAPHDMLCGTHVVMGKTAV